jgi:rubrerythrin
MGSRMKYKQTQASLFGKQTSWMCAYCGAVICTTGGRGKPHGACPSCDEAQWYAEDAPVAMFAEVNNGI